MGFHQARHQRYVISALQNFGAIPWQLAGFLGDFDYLVAFHQDFSLEGIISAAIEDIYVGK